MHSVISKLKTKMITKMLANTISKIARKVQSEAVLYVDQIMYSNIKNSNCNKKPYYSRTSI